MNQQTLPVRDANEIERSIQAFAQTNGGRLIVLPDTFTLVHRDLIVAVTAKHRLPSIYSFRLFAAAGGFLSYGINSMDQYPRAATYVDRILRGARPQDLPVQLPTKFELVINLNAAKALGLEVSPILLARADEVIE